MKALILAGGRGKRLGEITEDVNKCMLSLQDRPVLEYNLDRAVELDVDEIVLVVGYRAEDIINRYGISYEDTRIRYVIQWERRGLVHAIETSRNALEGEDFFLLLGDEVLINSRHREMLRAFEDEGVFAMCGILHQPERAKIGRTYTVLTDESGRVFRLIEKPKKPLSDLQGTGHCIFRNEIFSYIERTPIHPERGEKELPDLIQCAVDDGRLVRVFDICDAYTNINSEEDLLEAKRLLEDVREA
ncbi:MAG: UDP-N-acetylglucosamine diphosphorylase / glucose-phosphate thymidylyltransferase [Methanosarcinales archaeon]|uniref:nucleotidyltransferase family protein n=1 Tax=Methermicoccus shengliensis TaxID=660064 RepID=UPI0005B2A861|nr:nucleotidyltransferase family protein [Methermicoccus shengliensis]MDI3488677.1 UDP-N-acetylglucosamine diphosphorylase / glucose-phosphate thymidylyltransferase [Methanosarcinales archaeon]MDN5295784.1 UDP-N-acetylglucosamine diphosphorylase / glucose-phosphate thymidylyltransferase [Methanosarcinales archaeon]